jgi:hypothetical protein
MIPPKGIFCRMWIENVASSDATMESTSPSCSLSSSLEGV